jgi:hypothetical protein
MSASTPDIFCFSGDVRVPTQLLSLLEKRPGLSNNPLAPDRHYEFVEHLNGALSKAPMDHEPFLIVHGGRNGEGFRASFQLWSLSWAKPTGVIDISEKLPAQSVLAFAAGSGERAVIRHDLKWSRSEAGRTSRAVFSSFCDSLDEGSDRRSGGAPQLVGMFRMGMSESIGVIYHGHRYWRGVRDESSDHTVSEWRNCLFERCDPSTLAVLTGAQRHGRPKSLRQIGLEGTIVVK